VSALLLSAREAAGLLAVGRGKGRGLRALVELGALHPVPWIGGRVRYSLDEIQRIAREGVPPGAMKVRASRRRARRGPVGDVEARIRALEVAP
jgi:hypothetical protein